MKLFLLLMLMPVIVSAEDCSIPGKAEHWLIDYCLWINESDDFSQAGVQECYKEEMKQKAGKKACENKQYFKRKICEAHAYYEEGFKAEDCFADPEFQGPTVSNGGVKKIPVKSYLP